MILEDRLELVLNGYTPDDIGLLTMILNRKLAISEDQVRTVLSEVHPILEPIVGLFKGKPKDWWERPKQKQKQYYSGTPEQQDMQKQAAYDALNALVAQTKGARPELESIITMLVTVGKNIGINWNRKHVINLAKLIYDEWENQVLISNNEFNDQDIDDDFETRLKQVPYLEK